MGFRKKLRKIMGNTVQTGENVARDTGSGLRQTGSDLVHGHPVGAAEDAVRGVGHDVEDVANGVSQGVDDAVDG